MSNLTLKMHATYTSGTTQLPQFANVEADFATEAEAAEFAALFPKSYRVSMSAVSYGVSYRGEATRVMSNGETATMNPENPLSYTVRIGVKLLSTKGNDRNDAGIKRLISFLAKVAKAGHAVDYRNVYGNSYETADALFAALGEPTPEILTAPAAVEAPVETETEAPEADALVTTDAPVVTVKARKEIAEIVVGDKLGAHGLDLEVVEIREFPCYQKDVAAMLEAMGREPVVYSLKCLVHNPDEAVENGFPRSYLTREDGAAYWTIQGNTHPANVYTIRQ